MESVSPTKVLIWAKTYPELSTRHRETVCTGGWIEVPLRRNRDDPRPESFRAAKGIPPRVLHHASSSNGWEARREIVFSIVGLWYPMLAHQVQGSLFTP